MSQKKIIAVAGATGAQGGGLVQAILDDPNGDFAVRALTRNPNSDKARALADAGAEVVQADLDSYDSVRSALEGAYGAFLVTNFWEHFSAEKEYEQVDNFARAAKDAGVQHVVWSTLEDTRKWIPLEDDRMPTLQGKYKVPHFDGKGAADDIFRERDVPTTFLVTSFYWDNLIHFGAGPQRMEDGSVVFVLPMGDKPMASIAVEDIGKSAYGIFKRGDELVGETVAIAGEHVSGADFAAALSEVLGEPVHHYSPSFDEYRSYDFPGADDLGNMFQFYHDFADYVNGIRDVEKTRELNPDLMSFQQWMDKYGDQIPKP